MNMTLFHRLAVTAALALAGPTIATVAHAAPDEALCAGKGTTDEAKPIPPSLVAFAIRLYGEDADVVYRCVDNRAWICSYGVNIPCGKADTRRNIPEVIQFCRENPNEAVPPAASGHNVIYSWKCVRGKPVITSVGKVDARGYQAEYWTLVPGVQ
jgi:hypothetical protein